MGRRVALMLTTLLRPIVRRLLAPVGARIPVHPNLLSSLGLAAAVAAAAGFALGVFRWAAVGIAVSGMFDRGLYTMVDRMGMANGGWGSWRRPGCPRLVLGP